MSEYIKISDVVKICRSLYRSYGTIFDVPAPVFENLLRTVAVEFPEPPEVEELRKERDELQKELARYKWVSVKDRLPEKGTYDRYLVHVENTTNFNRLLDNVIIALWCDDDWLYDGWEDNRVTHWMPLPESPTKGE